jgi:hypothetical protein
MESNLSKYILAMHADTRITVWHLVLYVTLVCHWELQGFQTPFAITRRQVMRLSHIGSIPTYHKYLKDLIGFGYIRYESSFHPVQGSHFWINSIADQHEEKEKVQDQQQNA